MSNGTTPTYGERCKYTLQLLEAVEVRTLFTVPFATVLGVCLAQVSGSTKSVKSYTTSVEALKKALENHAKADLTLLDLYTTTSPNWLKSGGDLNVVLAAVKYCEKSYVVPFARLHGDESLKRIRDRRKKLLVGELKDSDQAKASSSGYQGFLDAFKGLSVSAILDLEAQKLTPWQVHLLRELNMTGVTRYLPAETALAAVVIRALTKIEDFEGTVQTLSEKVDVEASEALIIFRELLKRYGPSNMVEALLTKDDYCAAYNGSNWYCSSSDNDVCKLTDTSPTQPQTGTDYC